MSWSANGIGKASKVAAKIAGDIERSKCVEPEQTIKGFAGQAIIAALAAMPDDAIVKVEANGSQSPAYNGDHKAIPDKFTNSLSIKIETMGGFLS